MTDRIVSAAAVLVIAGALLVTFNVSSFAGPPLVDRAAPAHPTCSNSRPQVCVWPDQSAYLPELVTFARRASAAGTGVFPVPGVFHEFALTGNRDLTYSFVVLAQGPGLWSTAGGMADTMLNSAFLPRYCPAATAEDDARQTVQLSNLAYWLQARTYGGEYPHQFAGSRPDTTTVDHILTSSQADQKRWARTTLAQVLATPCAKTSAS